LSDQPKSHPPSAARLAEAIRQRKVPYSPYITTGLLLFAMMVVLGLCAQSVVVNVTTVLQSALTQGPTDISNADKKELSNILISWGRDSFDLATDIGLPLLLVALILVSVFGYIQIAPYWAWRLPARKASKRGFQIGMRLKTGAKNLFLCFGLLFIVVTFLFTKWDHVIRSGYTHNDRALYSVISLLFELIIYLAAFIVLFGLIHLSYLHYLRYKALSMTPSELKEEQRRHHGDPTMHAYKQKISRQR